jgi:uncharacterized membrane protein
VDLLFETAQKTVTDFSIKVDILSEEDMNRFFNINLLLGVIFDPFTQINQLAIVTSFLTLSLYTSFSRDNH